VSIKKRELIYLLAGGSEKGERGKGKLSLPRVYTIIYILISIDIEKLLLPFYPLPFSIS